MTDAPRLLLVEDDRENALMLKEVLSNWGYAVTTALSGPEALKFARSEPFEVVLADIRMPDVGGLQVLREIRQLRPLTQVVMMTGFGSVDTAVEAMKAGAFSFIEKTVDADVLLVMLDKATEKLQLSAENKRLKEELRDHTSFANIVARSDKMRQLFHLIKSVAPTDASVLIHGENGTGKELVASAIHEPFSPWIRTLASVGATDLIK